MKAFALLAIVVLYTFAFVQAGPLHVDHHKHMRHLGARRQHPLAGKSAFGSGHKLGGFSGLMRKLQGSDEDIPEGEEEEGEEAEEGMEAEEAEDQATDLQNEVAVRPAHEASRQVQDTDDESDLPETNNSDLDKLHEPEREPTVKATSRSKVPLQIASFPNTGGEFRGIPGGVVDGTNITHLSYMIFKLIKKYEITSVVDMPCRNTLHWFPALLHRLDFEIVGFKYYCVDSEANSQDDIRHLFGEAGSPELMHIKPEEAAQIPKADLLFSWNGPQDWGVRQTWAFFNGVREVRPEYLLITNNPGASNTNTNTASLNVRKQPFHVRFP